MLLTPKPDHHCSWSYASEEDPGDGDSRNGKDSADIESIVLLERNQSLRDVLHLRMIQPKFIKEIGQSALKARGSSPAPRLLGVDIKHPQTRPSLKSTATPSVLNVATTNGMRWRSDENLGALSSSDTEMSNEENNLLKELQFGDFDRAAHLRIRKETISGCKESILPTANTSCNTGQCHLNSTLFFNMTIMQSKDLCS